MCKWIHEGHEGARRNRRSVLSASCPFVSFVDDSRQRFAGRSTSITRLFSPLTICDHLLLQARSAVLQVARGPLLPQSDPEARGETVEDFRPAALAQSANEGAAFPR